MFAQLPCACVCVCTARLHKERTAEQCSGAVELLEAWSRAWLSCRKAQSAGAAKGAKCSRRDKIGGAQERNTVLVLCTCDRVFHVADILSPADQEARQKVQELSDRLVKHEEHVEAAMGHRYR